MKVPSVNNLIKKSDYNKKDNEIEKKITYHNHNHIILMRKEFAKILKKKIRRIS